MAGQLVAIQAFLSAGSPAAGAKFYTYAAGTTTPKAAYADEAGTVPLSNPVVCNASGVAVCWLKSGIGDYKFELKDSSGSTNLIRTIDNFTPNVDNILYLIGSDVETALAAALDAQAASELAQAAAETAQANAETAEANAASSASAASTSASNASTSASTATTQAGIATTQAGIATTQAGIATTQAGIATTQATNAGNSAAAAAADAIEVAAWSDADVDTPVEGPAGDTVTFDPSTALNTTTDVFTIVGHTFENDRQVTYRNGGGTSIAGLTHDAEYWVVGVSGDDFQLSATRGGSAVNTTDQGAGSAHELLPLRSAKHYEYYARQSDLSALSHEIAAAASAAQAEAIYLATSYANAAAAAADPLAAVGVLYFNTTDSTTHRITAITPTPASSTVSGLTAGESTALLKLTNGVIPNSLARSTLAIASGAVTPSRASHLLSAETGSADDLDTITLTNFTSGDLIKLAPTSGHTITFKHGTGNITTNTAADIVIGDDEYVYVHVEASGAIVFQHNGEPSADVLYAMAVRLGWVDARAYNGGAFNSTTIQAAIDANPSKTIFLAGGTWTITDTLLVTVGLTKIVGAGPETLLSVTSKTAIKFAPADERASPTINGCGLENLRIGYSGASITTRDYAIEAIKTNRLWVNRVYCFGFHFGIRAARNITCTYDTFEVVSPLDLTTATGSACIVCDAAETRAFTFDPNTAVDTGTDVITQTSHGFSDNQAVGYDALGGTDIGGLTSNTTYFVRDSTANTFKLAATMGGGAIDLTSKPTGETHEFYTFSRSINTTFTNFTLAGGAYATKTKNLESCIRIAGGDGLSFVDGRVNGGQYHVRIRLENGLGLSGLNSFGNTYFDGINNTIGGFWVEAGTGEGTVGPIQIMSGSFFGNYDDAGETFAIKCATPVNHLTIDSTVSCANQDVGIDFTGGDSTSRLTSFARLENCAVDGVRFATAKSVQLGGIIDGTSGTNGVEQLSGTCEQLIWLGPSLTNWTNNVAISGTVTYEKGFAVTDDGDTHWDTLGGSGITSDTPTPGFTVGSTAATMSGSNNYCQRTYLGPKLVLLQGSVNTTSWSGTGSLFITGVIPSGAAISTIVGGYINRVVGFNADAILRVVASETNIRLVSTTNAARTNSDISAGQVRFEFSALVQLA